MTTEAAAAHAMLLQWYRQNGRDLPWRHTADPYAIVVSELMLQQTQVDRVIPKYHEFLALFPTIHALADAPVSEVIRAWATLGYNQRAVRLQQLAKVIVQNHGGNIPSSVEELLALPGIGPYTAGAIACFAFHQPVATVDTNIKRVLCRVFFGAAAEQPSNFFTLASEVLPQNSQDVFDWNQALMDLGATICLARTPLCESCPLSTICLTFSQMQAITLFPSGNVLQELQAQCIAEQAGPYNVNTRVKSGRPFKESNRYFRGRIVDLLLRRPSDTGISLEELGPCIKPDYTPDDALWLRNIITGLIRDKLIIWADDACISVSLPK